MEDSGPRHQEIPLIGLQQVILYQTPISCKNSCMTIPSYQDYMLPLLNLASDGREWSSKVASEKLIEHFKLTEEEVSALLPSQTRRVVPNRFGWARTYLVKAGLLRQTRFGYFEITERGKEVMSMRPTRIDRKFLTQFPEFVEFTNSSSDEIEELQSAESPTESRTPQEIIEDAHQALNKQLVPDLLDQILNCSPTFFEKLVLDLLLAMGYGGSRKEAAQATKRSSDGGIDGIINEDKLGLESIYIQAKRWAKNRNVGRPEIQQFVGSLDVYRARKGVFITTSDFTREAREYADRTSSKIILINGTSLADLMIQHGVGVSAVTIFQINKVDNEYFVEE